MIDVRFFLTHDDCLAWFKNLDCASLQVLPMGTFDAPQTKLAYSNLSQFFESLQSQRVDSTYIVSDRDVVPEVVPKKRGNDNYFVYDRRANLHAWQIRFGGIKDGCFCAGYLFGDKMNEFGSSLVTKFYEIACFRSKVGDFLASKEAIALNKSGIRFLCGMDPTAEPAWDVKF